MLSSVLDVLGQRKQSDTAIVLGSGRSINSISDKLWDEIQSHDTWAINNWVYHPTIVPRFYQIETKCYAYELLNRRLKEKKEQYKNTTFLFPSGKHIRMKDGRVLPLKDVLPNGLRYFELMLAARGKRSDESYDADYKFNVHALHKSYNMSMTMLIELLYRLDYKRVVLFGVDLYNSFYFWYGGEEKYGKFHHAFNKQHEHSDPNREHKTSRIKEFIVDFNSRHFVPNNKRIYVGYKDTALYPMLECIDLMEEPHV